MSEFKVCLIETRDLISMTNSYLCRVFVGPHGSLMFTQGLNLTTRMHTASFSYLTLS